MQGTRTLEVGESRRFAGATLFGHRDGGETAPRRAEVAAVLALSAIALGLRLTSLSRSLFTDEAYSLALAQRSFGHMLGLFGYEANGTAYAVVLWPLVHIFGQAAAVLRAPAVAAGVASVPALWWAARRFAGPAVALLAAALLAINPMAVFYGHQARPYAFVVLGACLAFGSLARALEDPEGFGWWAAYVAAMALTAYSETLAAVLVLPAHALLVLRAPADARRRWILALGAILVLCVPLIVASAIERSRRNPLYWLIKPDRSLIVLALQEFTAGFSDQTALRWLTIAAGAALVLGAAVLVPRRGRRADPWPLAVALCWGLVPFAILLLGSIVTPLFYPRYAIVALPGLCLAVSVAAVRLFAARRGRLVPAAALAGAAAIVAAALAADYKQRDKLQESWPPALAFLSARTPNQPLLLDTVTVLPSLGYYDAAYRSAGDLVVQEWRDRPLPPGVIPYKDPHGFGNVTVGQPTPEQFAAAARRGGGSAWLLVSEADKETQGDPREGPAVAWARGHCQVTIRETVGVWVLRAQSCAG
jgi:mannosyltransferase